ncbi:hypothetical protein BMS3Abin07_00446 [bacterium BMS3Abin07]|nr:hypothetical protein BMS3Abin07_00446 [bacterium BMS3Abin07]GBE32743.1 hypothetical protein BMS3Bbin05_01662 [bacterium BMS3Bbin05]HDO23470.1 hypothetical protein [Nitrospirota bacterium]HDZ88986.1 hypothetical protein [Nitrospirota bacterium]
MTDERIPGSGDFVKEILEEADERVKEQFMHGERKDKIREVINEICKRSGVSVREVRPGGRRHNVSQARAEVAFKLVGDYGITLAEIAGNVGASTSEIFNIMQMLNN